MTNKLIGNLPNQVPTNGDLGSMAYQDAEAIKVKEVVVSKPFYIYQGNNYPDSGAGDATFTTTDGSNRLLEGRCARIGNGQWKATNMSDRRSGATKLLITGQRFAPGTGGSFNGTPIPIIKFWYKSPYRGGAYTTIKYAFAADGAYSMLTGELYLLSRDYNSSNVVVKTTDRSTTRNIIESHSSTGIQYLQYAYLSDPSTADNGVDQVTLFMYGTGSQAGNYTLDFSLEVTNLSADSTGQPYGIQDIVYA